MAIQIRKVNRARTAGAITSSAPRAVRNSQVVTESYLYYDNAGGKVDPSKLSEQHVMADVFLPQVNYDTFYYRDYNDDPRTIPWLVLNRKQIERDQQQRAMFHIIYEYGTRDRIDLSEGDLHPQNLRDTVEDYPALKETIWSEETRIIETEAVTSGQADMRLPTGRLFSEPFRRRHPRRILRQTQFEEIDDIQQAIGDRLFTVNELAFENDPLPSYPTTPPRWMITGIDYQNVSVWTNAASPTQKDCYMMTYTIERSSKDGGWWDRRALVDYYYLETADTPSSITPYQDPRQGYTILTALLEEDGTLKSPQSGDPNYKNYRVQPSLAWSFLK